MAEHRRSESIRVEIEILNISRARVVHFELSRRGVLLRTAQRGLPTKLNCRGRRERETEREREREGEPRSRD